MDSNPEPEVSEEDVNDAAARTAMLQEMVSDAAVDRALDDMPEPPASAVTTRLGEDVQELVSATISADLLSDRMFQLESSLSTFQEAVEAHGGADDDAADEEGDPEKDMQELRLPRRGGLDWSALDQQVFDLDIDKSRDHVQQYRNNLEEQTMKREELLAHLRELREGGVDRNSLSGTDLAAMDEQCVALERLFGVCCDADTLHKQRLQEQRDSYMASHRLSASETFADSYGGQQDYGYSRPSPRVHRPDGDDRYSNPYAAVQSPTRENSYRHQQYQYPDRAPPTLQRRHSSSSSSSGYYDREDDRFGGYRHESPTYAKRAKLMHSHSLEPQNAQWREAESPRFLGGDRGFEQRGPSSYAAVEREAPYGHQSGRYSPRSPPRYQPQREEPMYPPPRHVSGGRRSRWDSMPDDYGQRRW